jgi:hypothetical protein
MASTYEKSVKGNYIRVRPVYGKSLCFASGIVEFENCADGMLCRCDKSEVGCSKVEIYRTFIDGYTGTIRGMHELTVRWGQ